MCKKIYQIAIDGPAGSGKSTIAKQVAKRLNFQFINTGGMFRCYAIALQNTNLDDSNEVKKVLEQSKVTLQEDKLFLNNNDVTELANSASISKLASKIATMKIVRDTCLVQQREIASQQSCVMEGRDTTSVVLPNATLKIFLVDNIDVRAKRRWEQSGKVDSLENVKKALMERDYQDTHREIAPLIKTPGCKEIDGSYNTIDQTVNLIIDLFNKEIGNV